MTTNAQRRAAKPPAAPKQPLAVEWPRVVLVLGLASLGAWLSYTLDSAERVIVVGLLLAAAGLARSPITRGAR